MVTVSNFRQNFPEFTDDIRFLDGSVQFWLNFAVQMVNANRWRNITDMGVQLFAAHNLVLEVRSTEDQDAGGLPGTTVGPMNSKSVDKVSLGYDTAAGIEADAGHWNLTVYGTRFIRMAKMMGMGGITVGGGCNPDPLSSSNAWPGPDCTPWQGGFGS